MAVQQWPARPVGVGARYSSGARRAEQRLGAEGHVTFAGRLEAGARGRITRAILEEGRGGDFHDFDRIAAWATGIAAGLAAEAERR